MEQQAGSEPLRGYYDGCPIGTVLAYAGEWTKTLESLGWKLCNGAPMDVSAYSDLYAAIGNIYGGNSVTFNLPNLLGNFLRGVNTTSSGRDPNRKVGTLQDDAFKVHRHRWRGFRIIGSGAPFGKQCRADSWIDSDEENDCTNDVGGTETRPINIAMNYIIKVKNIM